MMFSSVTLGNWSARHFDTCVKYLFYLMRLVLCIKRTKTVKLTPNHKNYYVTLSGKEKLSL
jgi:hypothetical protein